MSNGHSVKESLAGLLSVRAFGPGYLELRNPKQFVAVYKIIGGLNPWIDSAELLSGKLEAFNKALGQLNPNEQVQIIARKAKANAEKYVEDYKKRIHENAAPNFRDKYSEFFKLWVPGFIEKNRVCDYEYYLLFTCRSVSTFKAPKASFLKNFLGFIFPFLPSFFPVFFGRKNANSNEFVSLEEVLRRGRTWATQLAPMGIEVGEVEEGQVARLFVEELSLAPFKGDQKIFEKGMPVSGGPGGFQNIREMLTTTPIFFEMDHFQIGRKFGKTIYVTEFPGIETVPLFLSHLFEKKNDFKISFFAKGVDQYMAKEIVEKQKRRDKGTSEDKGETKHDNIEAYKERNSALAAYSERKTSFVKYSLYITVYADSIGELTSLTETTQRLFSNFHKLQGYYEQKDLFLSTLPQCRDVSGHEYLSTGAVLANANSIFYDSLIENKGVVIGTTLSNQIACIDPWDRDLENWNVCVFGVAGAGKSFFVNQLLIKHLAQNPYVMIIDKSQSYKMACLAAGGKYLNIDLESKVHFNIFDFDLDQLVQNKGQVPPDHVAIILGFLNVILTEVDQKALPNLDNSLLEDAIKQTYLKTYEEYEKESKKGKKEGAGLIKTPLLRDLKTVLLEISNDPEKPKEFQVICKRYAQMLMPYTENGIYANLTDRETSEGIDSNFIVFDTSLLPDDGKPIALAVYIISQFCLNKARENRAKNRRSCLFLDETWFLAQYPSGVAFLLRLAKTSRHLSLFTLFATQQVSDFFKEGENSDVQKVLTNSATKVFLKLGGDEIDMAANLYKLNPSEVAILKSFKGPQRGEYSPAFWYTSRKRGVINVVSDEISYALATTYGPEVAERNLYLKTYAPNETPEEIFRAINTWISDQMNGRVLKFEGAAEKKG